MNGMKTTTGFWIARVFIMGTKPLRAVLHTFVSNVSLAAPGLAAYSLRRRSERRQSSQWNCDEVLAAER